MKRLSEMSNPLEERPAKVIKVDLTASSKIYISYGQHIASECLCCGEKSSPSSVAVPFIFIGRYREYMICKKSHLANHEELMQVEKKLTYVFDQIEQEGDVPTASFRDLINGKDLQALEEECVGFMLTNSTEVDFSFV